MFIKEKYKNKQYLWEGIDRYGSIHHGVCEAKSKHDAQNKLQLNDILIQTIMLSEAHKVKTKVVYLLLHHIATLLSKKIPISTTLHLLLQNHNTRAVKHLLQIIQNNLHQGVPLSQALAQNVQHIEKLSVKLIAVGESSGLLAATLLKLTSYHQLRQKNLQAFKKKLTYPCIVLIVATCVTIGLLLTIVPQFASIFQQFNAPLPKITRILINISLMLQHYGKIGLLCWMILTIGLYLLYHKAQLFSQWLQPKILHLPILGSWLLQWFIVRFIQALALGYEAGLPLPRVLELIDSIPGYPNLIKKLQQDLIQGKRLHAVLKQSGIFPSQLIQWVQIGESSGQLVLVLETFVAHTVDNLESSFNSLMQYIEPCLMILLGGMIGWLLIALYLPLFEFGSVIT